MESIRMVTDPKTRQIRRLLNCRPTEINYRYKIHTSQILGTRLSNNNNNNNSFIRIDKIY